MNILLTHPFCWPYVRRGTERNMEIVSDYMAARGHQVTVLSTHPERAAVERAPGKTRVLRRQLWTPALGRLHIEPQHTFFFTSLWGLRRMAADVVHCFFYTDALAASLASRTKRWRTVLQLNGIAIPGVSCRRFPPEAWILRRAIERVDEFMVCSRFIADLTAAAYGRRPRVAYPPVDLASWPQGPGALDGPPTVLSVADFEVRRKGVRVVVKAFCRLKKEVPAAVLKLSGRISEPTTAEILADVPAPVRRDIHVLGLGKPGDLPALYGSASITVLASMGEPSGGVMLESLAAGTPVVVTNHGGLPEFVNPEVGVLFDPRTEDLETHNDAGLCQAMLAGLALAGRPGTRARCHQHAAAFSTEAQGPLLEKIYAGN